MAMRVGIVEEPFFRSSEMMAHFGRNPVRGGRPPKDRRIREVMTRIVGVLFHDSEMELIDVDELIISVRNIGTVRKI